eukprot:jgi/Picsp_1/2171/NSC_05636-R1_protein grip
MDTTNLVQKRFRELATRAQEAGARIASQVKEQQSKFGNRSIVAGSQDSKQIQRESETETALKLVQFQNKALRDRLRSTAAENERLHEMLKQYRDIGLDKASVVTSSGPQRSEVLGVDIEVRTVTNENYLADKGYDDVPVRIPSDVDGTIRAVKTSSDADEKMVSNSSQYGKDFAHDDAHKEGRLEETVGLLREELKTQTLKHQREIEDVRKKGKEELNKLQAQLEETLNDTSAKKESTVEVELGEMQKKLESLEENLMTSRKERDEAISKASSLQSLVDEVSQLRLNHADEIRQLQEIVASKESKNAMLLQDIEELKSKSISEMDSLIDEASWLKHGAEELQSQLKESQEEKRLLEERVASIFSEMSTLKISKEENERELENQLHEMSLESTSCQKCTDYDAVVSQRDKAHGQIDLLTRDKEHLHTSLEEIRTEFKSRRADYEADIAERILNSEQLQAQVEKTEKEILRLQEELKHRILQYETITKEHEDFKAHESDIKGPYNDVILELQEAKSRNAQLEALLNREKNDFDSYRIQMELKIKNIEETLEIEQQEIENIKAMADILDSEDSLSENGLDPDDKHFILNDSGVQRDPKYATSITPNVTVSDKSPEYDDVVGLTDQAIESLQKEVKALQAALMESEHTHELRDAACQVLKEEIEELRRAEKRSSVDVHYLKAVLVKSFSCGELDSSSPIFEVISRLLQFSPDDIQRVKEKRQQTSDLMETANAIIGKWTEIVSGG